MLHILRFISLLVLLTALGTTIAKKNKDKDGDKLGKKSLKNISTCMGKPLDLSSQLSTVEECLTARLNEAMEVSDGKKSKEKKEKKLMEKLQKKCLAECEWSALGLTTEAGPSGAVNSSSTNGTTSGASTDAVESILKSFPSETHESLRGKIATCMNSPAAQSDKKKPCSKTKKMTKCLRKAVTQTCKETGRQGKDQDQDTKTPASTSTKSSVPSQEQTGKSTTATPTKENDDDDDEDDDDSEDDDPDDDDDDDDDESTTETDRKSATPSTMVDTSERITK